MFKLRRKSLHFLNYSETRLAAVSDIITWTWVRQYKEIYTRVTQVILSIVIQRL